MTTAPLRKCPTCGTSVEELDLGMRDWATWLGDTFPGRVGPMDVDWMLERKGKFLIIEFKSDGAMMPMGQRITLKALKRQLDADVWLVVEPAKRGDLIRVTEMNAQGNFDPEEMMGVTLTRFKAMMKAWWKKADA